MHSYFNYANENNLFVNISAAMCPFALTGQTAERVVNCEDSSGDYLVHLFSPCQCLVSATADQAASKYPDNLSYIASKHVAPKAVKKVKI